MEEKKNIKEKVEEKKLRCPFDRDLACENCRLHQAFPGGMGQKVCVFLRMGD